MSTHQPEGPYRGSRRRAAKGPPRPAYLRSEDNDRVWFTLVNVLGEVSALRDRLDTHEALAERGILPTQEAVEAYRPDDTRGRARGEERARMLRRVYRMLFQDYEMQMRRDKEPDLSGVIPALDP
jgi:hypothetical protein